MVCVDGGGDWDVLKFDKRNKQTKNITAILDLKQQRIPAENQERHRNEGAGLLEANIMLETDWKLSTEECDGGKKPVQKQRVLSMEINLLPFAAPRFLQWFNERGEDRLFRCCVISLSGSTSLWWKAGNLLLQPQISAAHTAPTC